MLLFPKHEPTLFYFDCSIIQRIDRNTVLSCTSTAPPTARSCTANVLVVGVAIDPPILIDQLQVTPLILGGKSTTRTRIMLVPRLHAQQQTNVGIGPGPTYASFLWQTLPPAHVYLILHTDFETGSGGGRRHTGTVVFCEGYGAVAT